MELLKNTANSNLLKKIQLIQKPELSYGEIADFYGNIRKSRAQISLPGLHCHSYPAFIPQE